MKKLILILTFFSHFIFASELQEAINKAPEGSKITLAQGEYLGNIVITEGIIDFYLFKMIQTHTNKIDKEIKFIPSLGASQSTSLISLALSYSKNFLIFLDNDKAGRKSLKQYQKQFGDSIQKNSFIYSQGSDNFVLENYFNSEDEKRLLEITNTDDMKKALGLLFYDFIDEQKTFITNLKMNKLEECFNILEKMSNK